MQTNLEMLGELQRRAHMSVAVEQVESEIQKRLSRLARTAKVAGFRPGKVPLKMIAQQYGPQVRMDVLNDVVNDTFVDLVQKENLRVAGYPQIEPRQDSTDQTKFEYTATFDGKDSPVTGSADYDMVTLKMLDPMTRHLVRKKGGKEVQTVHSVLSKDGKHYTSTTKGVNAKGQQVESTAVYDKQ